MNLSKLPLYLSAAALTACATPDMSQSRYGYAPTVSNVSCNVADLVETSINLSSRLRSDEAEGACLFPALALKLDREFSNFDAKLVQARTDISKVKNRLTYDFDRLSASMKVASEKGFNIAPYLNAHQARKTEVFHLTSMQLIHKVEQSIAQKLVFKMELDRLENHLAKAEKEGLNVAAYSIRFEKLKIIALRQIAEYKLTQFETIFEKGVSLNEYQLKNVADAIADLSKEGIAVGDLLRRLNAISKKKPCEGVKDCHIASFTPRANVSPAMDPTLLP